VRNRARGEIDVVLELGILARQIGGLYRCALLLAERHRLVAHHQRNRGQGQR